MHYFSLKNERVHNHLLGEITKQVQSICSLRKDLKLSRRVEILAVILRSSLMLSKLLSSKKTTILAKLNIKNVD